MRYGKQNDRVPLKYFSSFCLFWSQERAIWTWGCCRMAWCLSTKAVLSFSTLTGCWEASPAYFIHFSPSLCPSSFLFMCPSLLPLLPPRSLSLSLSHTHRHQSLGPLPGLSTQNCVCVCVCVCVIKSESDRRKGSAHRFSTVPLPSPPTPHSLLRSFPQPAPSRERPQN